MARGMLQAPSLQQPNVQKALPVDGVGAPHRARVRLTDTISARGLRLRCSGDEGQLARDRVPGGILEGDNGPSRLSAVELLAPGVSLELVPSDTYCSI